MSLAFLQELDEYIAAHHYRLVNTVMVYQKDTLIFERYYNHFTSEHRNQIKSVWKSILSLALGICLDKGIITSLDEPISRYLPSFAEKIHPYHSLITIRHLLTMSSGIYWNGGVHYHCPMLEQLRRSRNWVSHIADVQMSDLPGKKFVYKEWDVILLSAVISQACGSSVWDFCRQQLYQPLEIAGTRWTQSPCGVDYPSYDEDTTSDLTALDLAKIGRLCLNKGVWQKQRIISAEYIHSMVVPSAANGSYGFLWWLSEQGYHGRGFGGQELNVYPSKKIVAVVQATVTPSSKSYADICEKIIQT